MTGPDSADSAEPSRMHRRAMSAAYRLLAVRDRSILELSERLLARFSEDIVDQVVQKLAGFGYLDDQALAERLTENWIDQRHFGPRRLRHELFRRKFSAQITDSALEKHVVPERIKQAALRAARACLKTGGGHLDDRAARRLAGYLGRRGFMESTIRDMVHLARQGRLWDDPPETAH